MVFYFKSKNTYGYNSNVCYCTLDITSRKMFFDHIDYLIPAILLFIGSMVLITTYTKRNQMYKNGTNIKSSEYNRFKNSLIEQAWFSSSGNKDSIVHQYMRTKVDAETIASFTYIGFMSSVFLSCSYGFLLYGNCMESGNCSVQAVSNIVGFAGGAVRPIIVFIVIKVMSASLKERETESRAKANKKKIGREYTKIVEYNVRTSKSTSKFTSFSLASDSIHHIRVRDRMRNFWSERINSQESSIEDDGRHDSLWSIHQ